MKYARGSLFLDDDNVVQRVRAKLGLTLHHKYFTILNKIGSFEKSSQHTENCLAALLVALFTVNHFTLGSDRFTELYGPTRQTWTGLIR